MLFLRVVPSAYFNVKVALWTMSYCTGSSSSLSRGTPRRKPPSSSCCRRWPPANLPTSRATSQYGKTLRTSVERERIRFRVKFLPQGPVFAGDIFGGLSLRLRMLKTPFLVLSIRVLAHFCLPMYICSFQEKVPQHVELRLESLAAAIERLFSGSLKPIRFSGGRRL